LNSSLTLFILLKLHAYFVCLIEISCAFWLVHKVSMTIKKWNEIWRKRSNIRISVWKLNCGSSCSEHFSSWLIQY